MSDVQRKRKICLVGDFAVGKTSLTQRFVNNVFSEKYLTTIGVKIDQVDVGSTKLIIWDVAGRDAITPLNASYLAGAAGVVFVADGTRADTIDAVAMFREMVDEKLGKIPAVVAINKADMPDWQISATQQQALDELELKQYRTSALDGSLVPELFQALVDQINAQP